MGFLDNLENSLNSLEKAEERDPMERHRVNTQRETEKKSALAAAPYAEALRKGAFTMDLLTHATRIGHGQRTAVQIVWLGTTLRMQAKERRLELQPTASGIVAIFSESGVEKGQEAVDLKGDSEKLARKWLSGSLSRDGAPGREDTIDIGQ